MTTVTDDHSSVAATSLLPCSSGGQKSNMGHQRCILEALALPFPASRSSCIPGLWPCITLTWFFCFFKDFIYLLESERESMSRGRARGRGRSRLPCRAGSPIPGSILGPWNRDLSCRQTLHRRSLPDSPICFFHHIFSL